jgi:hypothetical protein
MSLAAISTGAAVSVTLPAWNSRSSPSACMTGPATSAASSSSPAGWTLGPDELLLDDECRLVRVLELVLFDEPARIAAAVTVAPARAFV